MYKRDRTENLKISIDTNLAYMQEYDIEVLIKQPKTPYCMKGLDLSSRQFPTYKVSLNLDGFIFLIVSVYLDPKAKNILTMLSYSMVISSLIFRPVAWKSSLIHAILSNFVKIPTNWWQLPIENFDTMFPSILFSYKR